MTTQPPPAQVVSDATYRYLQVLLDHKHLVGAYLRRVTAALFQRAVEHDASKFGAAEFAPYAEALPRFEQADYGTDEYIAVCRSIKPAIDHHLSVNRHHPEYFPRGVNDMNLIDVVEMVCDWIAASQRGGGGPLRLDLQRERFAIDDQLYGIICRTVDYLMTEETPA